MLKRMLILLAIIIVWNAFLVKPVAAESGGEYGLKGPEIVDLADEIDLAEVQGLLNQLDNDAKEAFPGFSLAKIFNDLKTGQVSFNLENIGRNILQAILTQLVSNAPLIAKLLGLAVICAIINQVQSAFLGNVSKLAKMLVYLVLLGLALTSFKIAVDIGIGAIDQMVSFMQAVLPVMYTILLAMGNITSSALFKPLVMGSLVVLATLIKNIILPLFFFGVILRLFNNISPQFKLTRFADLLEFGGKLAIGIVLTVFVGIMTVQGVAGGVADGVTLRTAKYSVDLIPVIGKFFKDAVELVISSGLLLKNALGIVAMLAIVLIISGPAIKIAAMMLTFKIAAALVEPLGEKELAESLQDMSKGLLYIFATVSSVAVMFFISITIIVGAGNLAVMLR